MSGWLRVFPDHGSIFADSLLSDLVSQLGFSEIRIWVPIPRSNPLLANCRSPEKEILPQSQAMV